MSEKKFDPTKAAFYLVAAVIGVHLLMSIVVTFACVYIALNGGPRECADGKILEVLSAALAAALAFAGGRMSK